MIPITENKQYNSQDSAFSKESDRLSLTVPELKERIRALPDGMILSISLKPVSDSGGNNNGKT